MAVKRLTQEIVIKIDVRTKSGEDPKLIAADYDLNPKTIERIKHGITWSRVTGNKPTGAVPVDVIEKFGKPPKRLTSLKRADILDVDPHDSYAVQSTREALAAHLGLDLGVLWAWGRYRAWDGVFSAITDHRIAWVSEKLAEVFANLGYTELSTFPLGEVFSYPPEDELFLKDEHEHGFVLRLETRDVVLSSKHAEVALRQGLQIRKAGDREDFVYLTVPSKTKRLIDNEPSIHACVAVKNL